MYCGQAYFVTDLISDKMKKYNYSIFAGLLPVFVLGFVSHMIPYIYIPSLPQIAECLALGQSNTTTLMSSYYLSMSLSLLLTGMVGDRWDKRYLLYVASALITIGAVVASFRPLYYLILAGWSFQGIGGGIITVVSQTWIGQSSERHNITSRFSYMSIVLSLAPLVAPVIGGLITETYSWKYNFYTMGVLSLLTAILIYRASPPKAITDNGISIRHTLHDYIRLLCRTIFLPIITASLVCFMFQGALMAYSSFLFIDQLGLSPAIYGFISVPVVTGCIIGSLSVMYIEKRLNIEAAFIFSTIIAVVALLASLLFYMVTGTHTVTELALVILIFSIGFGAHTLLAIRNVMTYFKSQRSQSSALVNFLNQFIGYIAVLSVQILFIFMGSAMAIHNMACAFTVVLLIISTLLYMKCIRIYEISL